MAATNMLAQKLIKTVARAFYGDDLICLIDVLVRDRFLRDDDMGRRLSLPGKQLRSRLQFLQMENIVSVEKVDDLSEGGSRASKYFYIDYNRAVGVISLRLHLMRKELEDEEIRLMSESVFECPGFSKRRCNGLYKEQEVQSALDPMTGFFLCPECKNRYVSEDPRAPPVKEYTLRLIDNTFKLCQVRKRLNHFHKQIKSSQKIEKAQGRPSIVEILNELRKATRQTGSGPSSNIPSENRSLVLGTRRIAGTGRNAKRSAVKLVKQGICRTLEEAYARLVGEQAAPIPEPNENEDRWKMMRLATGQRSQYQIQPLAGMFAHSAAVVAPNSVPKWSVLDSVVCQKGPCTQPFSQRHPKRATSGIRSQEPCQQKARCAQPWFLTVGIGPSNMREKETHKTTVKAIPVVSDHTNVDQIVISLSDNISESTRLFGGQKMPFETSEKPTLAERRALYKKELEWQFSLIFSDKSKANVDWIDGEDIL